MGAFKRIDPGANVEAEFEGVAAPVSTTRILRRSDRAGPPLPPFPRMPLLDHAPKHAGLDLRIDLSRSDALMPEEFLDVSDGSAAFEEMSGKRMAKSVRADADADASARLPHDDGCESGFIDPSVAPKFSFGWQSR